MTKSILSSYTLIAASFITGCFFAVGCGNSDAEINALTEKKVFVEEAKKVEGFMSQNGKMKAKLVAPEMNYYQVTGYPDTSYYEFPKSLHVDFYNDSLELESKLDALYGKYRSGEKKVFLRDSIVVINMLNGDTLYCDELWWDQQKESFFTDKKVRIRTKTQVLDGIGMDARQDFTEWSLHKPVGDIKFRNDEF
mgnify:CR=1 FL=1